MEARPVGTVPVKTVTVFGASWCRPGDGSGLYEESVALGGGIAGAGFRLVNGGYLGTMEGTAKGAAGVAGSERVGVTVPGLFRHRSPTGNDYLSSAVPTPSLLDRIHAMIKMSSYFVVMNGTLGTLTELAIIWNIAALGPDGGYDAPLILLYRKPWEGVITSLAATLNLPPAHTARLRFIDTADEAVALIAADYAARTAASPLPSTPAAGGGAAAGGAGGAPA